MDDKRLSLGQHLEELRRRFLFSLGAVILGSIAAYSYSDAIIHWLARPVGSLVFLAPTEAFLSRLKIAFYSGAFIAMPVILYQAWEFIATALNDKEKKALFWILPASYVLFAAGASLCLFIVGPNAVKFLIAYGSEDMKPLITISEYLGFMVSLTLAFGLLFQLPLIMFFLGWLGVVSVEQFSSWRRLVYLVSFIVAAFLTPGPDVFSQFLLAIPTIVLYELTLMLMRPAFNRRVGA